MMTLAGLCTAHGIDLDSAAAIELKRLWASIDKVRAKQKMKPHNSPLPGPL
jgi:hypothetical protein